MLLIAEVDELAEVGDQALRHRIGLLRLLHRLLMAPVAELHNLHEATRALRGVPIGADLLVNFK